LEDGADGEPAERRRDDARRPRRPHDRAGDQIAGVHLHQQVGRRVTAADGFASIRFAPIISPSGIPGDIWRTDPPRRPDVTKLAARSGWPGSIRNLYWMTTR